MRLDVLLRREPCREGRWFRKTVSRAHWPTARQERGLAEAGRGAVGAPDLRWRPSTFCVRMLTVFAAAAISVIAWCAAFGRRLSPASQCASQCFGSQNSFHHARGFALNFWRVPHVSNVLSQTESASPARSHATGWFQFLVADQRRGVGGWRGQ